jgi:hypothetical protein
LIGALATLSILQSFITIGSGQGLHDLNGAEPGRNSLAIKSSNDSSSNTRNVSVDENQVYKNISTTYNNSRNLTTKPLLIALFTLDPDVQVRDIIKAHLSQNNDSSSSSSYYIAQSIRSLVRTTWWFDSFPNEKKMILVQSLRNMTATIDLANRYSNTDLIVYDIEEWSKTPKRERNNAVKSITKGADIVHDGGYKYGIAPSAEYLIEHYRQINWSNIDFVDMQLQRFSEDPTTFSNYTRQIGSFIKEQNPDILLFVQLSFSRTDYTQTSAAIQSVKDIVDGIFIAYIPEGNTNDDNMQTLEHTAAGTLDRILGEVRTVKPKGLDR